MDFFQHQSHARKQTRWLVLVFALAVAAVVVAVTGAVTVFLLLMHEDLRARGPSALLPAVAAGTLAVIGIASLYKTIRLRDGGGSVARALGADLIPANATQPRYRRLRNVIEEMAIASGVPVPEIYVLAHDNGINAFAAGWSPADAAVAVTRGALEKLSRDELQGVVAHEFSHILNGDIRLNIRLMGLLFGILITAEVGRAVLTGIPDRHGKRKGGGGYLLPLAIALVAIGSVGLFCARLIKAGVSRQREYLADASAVQFTRQTAGLAGALKKIAGVSAGSRLDGNSVEEVSHMLFGDGVGYSRLFATHPPLLARIRRLDPQFRINQLREHALVWNRPDWMSEDADSPVTTGMATVAAGARNGSVADRIGHPSADDFHYAEAVHTTISAALLALAADPDQTPSLLLALLLDERSEVRKSQRDQVASHLGETTVAAVDRCSALLSDLPASMRLPLAELAFPGLRRLPREGLVLFMTTVGRLIQADGAVSLFEFCLGSLLQTHVADLLHPERTRTIGKQRLGHLRAEALNLLAALAQQGHTDPAARHAFQAGLTHLFPQASDRYEPPTHVTPKLSITLRALDQLDAPGKQLLIEAMATTVHHDRRVTVGEAELLRVICGALHCPLPPLAGVDAAAA